MNFNVLLITLYRMIPGKFKRTCPNKPSCSQRALAAAYQGISLSVILSTVVCAECLKDENAGNVPRPKGPKD
jgi:putative component of membrane protein insertase Oxa1/YidC/SpoIIIJ protein YidD